MRSISRSIASATGLLVLAAGLVALPASPSLAAADPAVDGTALPVVSSSEHEHHTFESAPGVPMDGLPSGLALQTEATVTAPVPIKVKLVTAKLADTGSSIVDIEAAKRAVAAVSSYWKAMSGGRISMTVDPAQTKVGHVSAAKSTQPYYDLINKITAELKWTYSTNTALVVFVPSTSLSGGALGAAYSSNGNSGRVVMPKISGFTNPVLSHEFGHVLGSMHADALQCGSGVSDVGTTSTGQFKDASCYIREYGDSTDLMGMSSYSMPVVSSPFWEARGLGQGTEIRNVGVASGVKSYTLLPWGGTAPGRALKFTDPISREVYYLELRQAAGSYDSYLSASTQAGNRGVKIVQRGGATPASSLILMPSTRPFVGTYAQNHVWQAGQVFATHTGTRVTINSVTATAATVTINADPATRAKIQFSAGDFNGDGRADVFSRETDGTLFLRPGQAGNKFGTPIRLGGGWNIFNTVIGDADYTGDGHPDVLGRTSEGILWLYPGNGNGGFLPQIRIGANWHIFARLVAPGDLTGDGKRDLVGIKPDGSLWLYPGNGAGGFPTTRQIGSGWNTFTAVAPASGFSGTRGGLMARSQDGTLYFYPGNGAGGILAPIRLGGGWASFQDFIGGHDFNGDAQTDLLVTSATGSMSLYPGNRTGAFSTRVAVGTGWDEFRQVWEAGDATGDSIPDVFALTTQGTLWLHPGNGSGSFQAARQLNAGWQTYDQIFTAGNFDGTGGPDLIARDADGVLWVYPTDGKGKLLPRKLLARSLQGFTRFLSPGDFTGDGKSDLLAQSTDGRLWLYPGNGSGGLQSPKSLGFGWDAFNQIAAANDFTGDGKNDIMARTTSGALWLYPGNGAGGFLPRTQLGSAWNIYKSIANVGRFAGTGSPGMIATALDGVLWLYSGNSRGGFQASILNPR
jgi:hypothetical protein